jgi:hypothetical protein
MATSTRTTGTNVRRGQRPTVRRSVGGLESRGVGVLIDLDCSARLGRASYVKDGAGETTLITGTRAPIPAAGSTMPLEEGYCSRRSLRKFWQRRSLAATLGRRLRV